MNEKSIGHRAFYLGVFTEGYSDIFTKDQFLLQLNKETRDEAETQ